LLAAAGKTFLCLRLRPAPNHSAGCANTAPGPPARLLIEKQEEFCQKPLVRENALGSNGLKILSRKPAMAFQRIVSDGHY